MDSVQSLEQYAEAELLARIAQQDPEGICSLWFFLEQNWNTVEK